MHHNGNHILKEVKKWHTDAAVADPFEVAAADQLADANNLSIDTGAGPVGECENNLNFSCGGKKNV